MAADLAQMIDEVLDLLQGASTSEQATTLAATMGSADASFSVTNTRGVATGVSPGILEIDRELLYADTVNSNGTITVPAWGRGYRSTIAANHLAGSRVTSQPTFPRQKIVNAINQTLTRIFPSVYAVNSLETVTTLPQITYILPATAQRVLSAKWLMPDGRGVWENVRRFRMSPGGGTLAGDTGRTVDIADAMIPGQPLQILYSTAPVPMLNDTDDFETVTGLDISVEDVVTTGAAVAMLPAQELSRLQTSSVEQQNRSQLVAPSAALTSTRFLEQRFQTRLAEERKSLQDLHPPRITRSWN